MVVNEHRLDIVVLSLIVTFRPLVLWGWQCEAVAQPTERARGTSNRGSMSGRLWWMVVVV